MLRAISWFQFTGFLITGLFFYYGYLGLMYYRTELLLIFHKYKGLLLGLPGAADQADGGPVQGVLTTAEPEVAAHAERSPGQQSDSPPETKGENKITDVGNKTAESDALARARFQATESVIGSIEEVLKEAVATGLSREAIEQRLQRLLAGYRGLHGTEYEAIINIFIERSCRDYFALDLTGADLQRLWGRGQQEQSQKMSDI